MRSKFVDSCSLKPCLVQNKGKATPYNTLACDFIHSGVNFLLDIQLE
jgi:hypothetical protein